MTLAYNIFRPMPLRGYWRERLGDRQRLVAKTEYRTAENGDTVLLRRTVYGYASDGDRLQTTGYFCEPLVRFGSIYGIETDKFQDTTDFEHYPVQVMWRKDRLVSETVTDYAENGTSRTVTRTFGHVPFAGGFTPLAGITRNQMPDLIRRETVSCAGSSVTTTRSYSYDAATGHAKTARDWGWITLETERTVTLPSGTAITRRNTFDSNLWPVTETTETADGAVIDSVAIECDAKGNPVSVSRNGAYPVTYGWTGNGYPESKTIGDSLTTKYTWKPLVGLASVKSPSGMTTAYGYEGERLVSAAVNSVPVVRYAYGRAADSDALFGGNSVATVPLDADGRDEAAAVKVTDASGNVIAEATGVPGSDSFITGFASADALGRVTRTYAPVTTGASPDFDGESLDNLAWRQYQGDSVPFSDMTYIPGADARPRSVSVIGEQFAGKPARTSYSYNRQPLQLGSHAASWQICRKYSVAVDGTVSVDGTWPAGSLEITKDTDGDGRVVYTYTDFLGRRMLTRVDLTPDAPDNRSADRYLEIYYVYDDGGRLACVLPPKATAQTPVTENTLDLYAFRYTYDGRWRLSSRKTPGNDPVTIVTDLSGTATLTQDGTQKRRGTCTFAINDRQGRPAITGECRMTAALVSAFPKSAVYALRDQTSAAGYRVSLPMAGVTVDRAWYYDDYSFMTLGEFTRFGTVSPATPRKGGCLGTLSRVLDPGADDATYMASYTVADDRERPVRTVTSTLSGGTVTEEIAYDNAGRVTDIKTTLRGPAGETHNTLRTLTAYDRHGRAVSVSTSLDSRVSSAVANTYDNVGRLSCRKADRFATAYTYTTGGAPSTVSTGGRLWLTLGYNGSHTGMLTSQTWTGADKVTRKYEYGYDGASRLAEAVYSESGRATAGQYGAVYGYDPNSNLTSVTRQGLSGVAKGNGNAALAYGTVDELTLLYEGNRLTKVDDGADTPVFTGAPDFSDGADESVEYTYDECGRTLSDLNRGVDSVAYNTVGLPETIHFSDGTYMRQIYLADGRLQRRVTAKGQDAIGGTIGTPGRLTLPGITLPGGDRPTVEIKLTLVTTDYVGPMVFENGRLARAETPGASSRATVCTPMSATIRETCARWSTRRHARWPRRPTIIPSGCRSARASPRLLPPSTARPCSLAATEARRASDSEA